jgi:hypothetical protein
MAASWRGRPDLISPLHRVIAAIAGGVDVRAPIIRSQVRSATHACTGCGSAFRLDRGFALCSVCASTALAGPRCPFCSVTRWSPLGLSADRAACPICREAMIIPEPTARLW